MTTHAPARTLTVTWQDPSVLAAAARTRSGLEVLRAIGRGELPLPPVCELLKIKGIEASEGRVVFSGEPHESQYNPTGMVHGGVLASLMDSALGCAVFSTLPAGQGYTTADLSIRFFRPVTEATGTLTCEAKIVHRGNTLATTEARLTDSQGRLHAHATSTLMIFRPQ